MPTLDALSSPLIPALISSYSMHWQVRSRKPPHIILKYIHAQVKNSNENCSLDMSETKHCLSQVSFTFISRSPLRISFICAPFLSKPHLLPLLIFQMFVCLFLVLNMLVYCGSFVYGNTSLGLLQCNPFHTESPILKRGKQIVGHKGFRPMTLGLLWCHCE